MVIKCGGGLVILVNTRRDMHTQETKERFLSHVDVKGEDECWTWQACLRNDRGYGNFWNNNKNHRAHRVSWEIFNGEIPKDLHVLHRCDNRVCVNPSHLFLGTHQDNMSDMKKKGRVAIENNGLAKLNYKKAKEIRARHNAGESLGYLSKLFGVTIPTIWYVIKYKSWKDPVGE